MTQPLLGLRPRGGPVTEVTELYDRHAAGLFAYCHDQLGDPGAAAGALTAVFAAVEAAGPRHATVAAEAPASYPAESSAAEAAGPHAAAEDAGPPRAALYALARREIQHRDVVYAPPVVGADLVASFVGRILRDLRPHQREVLYLSGVCEMDAFELSWVLDVAADTADELTVSACRRFAQALRPALASMRVPDHMAEVFGALDAAPIRDVLARAPWAVPPPGLRATVLGATAPGTPGTASAPSGVRPVTRPGTVPAPPGTRPGTASASRPSGPPLRALWPAPPVWPLPPSAADALTGTTVFPLPGGPAGGPRDGSPVAPSPAGSPGSLSSTGSAGSPGASDLSGSPGSPVRDRASDPLSPPDPDAVSAHEATTEPMPRLRDSVLTSLDDMSPRARRARLRRPSPRGSAPGPAPLPAPVPGDVLEPETPPSSPPPSPDGFPSVGNLFQPLTPEARAALIRTDRLVAAAPREERDRDGRSTDRGRRQGPDQRVDQERREDSGPQWEHGRRLPGWPLRTDELDDLPASGAAASPAPDRAPYDEWPIVDWTAPERPVRVHGTDRAAGTGRPLSGREPEGTAAAGTSGLRTAATETHALRTTGTPGLRTAAAATTDFQEVAAWRAEMLANTGDLGDPVKLGDPVNAEVGATVVTGVRTEFPETGARMSRASRTARTGGRSHRRTRRRPGRHAERHHDWVWELAGFLICVAIAMIVFLAMPALTP
ncbi:hypothetical protein AB0D67_16125 [Streptosporangium sp. NPDC048047]|uniref:hypothetical protein n=1 Tax=Streptosporangium sp. NPDC048047 TaxID=3155748 RepID=UPI00343B94D0